MAHKRLILAALSALPLSACISFAAKPPPSLFTLSATERPATVTRSVKAGQAITVLVPTVPMVLQTMRLAVRTSPTDIAYLKGAQWSEPPARLLTRVLGEVITQRTGRVVLTAGQTVLDPGLRLNGELSEFGIDKTKGQAVHIRYAGAIVAQDGSGIETRQFDVVRPLTSEQGTVVAATLNAAANDLAVQVADWVATR